MLHDFSSSKNNAGFCCYPWTALHLVIEADYCKREKVAHGGYYKLHLVISLLKLKGESRRGEQGVGSAEWECNLVGM